MRLSPSSSSMVGSQPSFFLASVISGCRCLGSSFGNDLNTIFEEEPVMAIIFFANSCIENSFGLPRFTGPVKSSSVSIILIIPSIRSSIYWKLRVCFPSPYIVMSSLFNACRTKFETTLPSFGSIRGPYVLNMRIIFTRTSFCR